MKIQLKIFSASLFIIANFASQAANDSIAENIFKMIYNEQFEQAEKALAQTKQQIEPFYAEILTIDLYWWKYIKSNEKEESKKLLAQIAVLEQSVNSTEGKIKQLVAKSYQIRYFLKRFNIVGASLARSEIKNLLEAIKYNVPERYTEKRLQLFYIYDSLFIYFDNLFNPFFFEKKRFTRSVALNNVEKFLDSDDLITQTLSAYFLGKIYLNIENEPEKAKVCFQLLSGKYPQNKIFDTLLTECGEH